MIAIIVIIITTTFRLSHYYTNPTPHNKQLTLLDIFVDRTRPCVLITLINNNKETTSFLF